MTKSYNDPVKQLARAKLRDFIAKHLLFVKKSKDVRVVCFPGAEVEGEEALEVKEIYDPLGIPRQNITGLEINPKKAELLRRANLGINVVSSSDLNFFKETDNRFDVVSLDYTGQQTKERLDALRFLSGRAILTNYAVLHTNYSGKRESKEMQRKMIGNAAYEFASANSEIRTGINIDLALDYIKNQIREGNGLKECRDSISDSVVRIFVLGKDALIKDSIFFKNKKILEIYKQNKDLIKSADLREEISEEEERLLREFGLISESNTEENTHYYAKINALSQYLENYFVAKGVEIHFGGADMDAPLLPFANFLESKESKSMMIKERERYSYNSNKNALMLSDFSLFVRPTNLFNSLDDIIVFNENTADFSVNRLRQSPHKINSKLRKILSEYHDLTIGADPANAPERVYLGSSYVRGKKEKETISKEDAVYLLANGVPSNEILETYSGLSKMQLAAFKAHITMGNYKDLSNKKSA